MHDYRAPRWLPGGHLQTIWPAFFSRRFRGERPRFVRERVATPDGDFVDIDWLGSDRAAPALVLFHGLEGSSASHYAEAFAADARARGLRVAIPHFRGCSGEPNRRPRAYHSGDHDEVGWMLGCVAARHDGPVVAVGVSLGGSALLRWAEEQGEAARTRVRALAAISAPLDLAAGEHVMARGFNRFAYTRTFLRTMKKKAIAQAARHPGLLDVPRIRRVRDLRGFDDLYTAPLHGFRDADDYYARASAGRRLAQIALPALVVNARNDPFLPASALPRPGEVGPHVTLWQPAHGGHVGFPTGRWPGTVASLPGEVTAWLLAHVA